ncbi:MAG TPA: type II toxin-antitoxin system VapC family toxin [Candidatus Acidoferrales bacterium]|jgi:predicted nucleic acid-binding protein|nr:type II toxin-antitoxin system VapC family toxin [Candidatus Acidoferrales bacterium]
MAVFVPDASATLAWCFEDETSDWTEALLAKFKSGDTAVVPQHWPAEVANTFLVGIRRGRVTKDKAARFLQDLLTLPIRIDFAGRENVFDQVFPFAAKYGLTVYDAAYLELAYRERIALATLDDDLKKAARAAGVSLVFES